MRKDLQTCLHLNCITPLHNYMYNMFCVDTGNEDKTVFRLYICRLTLFPFQHAN